MGRVCLNEEGWKGLESVGNEKIGDTNIGWKMKKFK